MDADREADLRPERVSPLAPAPPPLVARFENDQHALEPGRFSPVDDLLEVCPNASSARWQCESIIDSPDGSRGDCREGEEHLPAPVRVVVAVPPRASTASLHEILSEVVVDHVAAVSSMKCVRCSARAGDISANRVSHATAAVRIDLAVEISPRGFVPGI